MTVGDGSTSLRAFVLERNGKAYATVWDDKGETKLSIDRKAVVSYTKEIESGEKAIEYAGENAIISVSDKAYICSDMSIAELTEALKNAMTV